MVTTRRAAKLASFALACAGMQVTASPVARIRPDDCLAERQAMEELGYAAGAREQIAEANSVAPDRYGEFLDAFRAGLKASMRDGDEAGAASYRLSICAFEVAALRGRQAASGPQADGFAGPATPPETASAAPVLINGNQAGGFVAPPKPRL